MKSLWGNLENITSEVRNPKEIIEGQASFFNNTEGNLAFIEVKSKKLTAIGKKDLKSMEMVFRGILFIRLNCNRNILLNICMKFLQSIMELNFIRYVFS